MAAVSSRPPKGSAASTQPGVHAQPASSSKVRVAWPHVALSILGIGAGLYAIHIHALIEAGQSTGCGITDTISCDKVIGSNYGEFFGLPLGFYGALFWAIVLVFSFSGAATSPPAAAWQRLGIASVGLLTSLVLAYVSLGVIGKFCPVCAATHVLSGLNFLVAAWGVKAATQAAATQTKPACAG